MIRALASSSLLRSNKRALQHPRAPRTTAFSSAAETPSRGGFLQRMTSFFVGAGLMALGTQYYLYQELREGNKAMLKKQNSLEKRLAALEK